MICLPIGILKQACRLGSFVNTFSVNEFHNVEETLTVQFMVPVCLDELE